MKIAISLFQNAPSIYSIKLQSLTSNKDTYTHYTLPEVEIFWLFSIWDYQRHHLKLWNIANNCTTSKVEHDGIFLLKRTIVRRMVAETLDSYILMSVFFPHNNYKPPYLILIIIRHILPHYSTWQPAKPKSIKYGPRYAQIYSNCATHLNFLIPSISSGSLVHLVQGSFLLKIKLFPYPLGHVAGYNIDRK